MRPVCRNVYWCLCVVVLWLTAPSLAHAGTIIVGPTEARKTIQAGIDAAKTGDIVLVRDGIYKGEGNREIDFKGKAITVKSEHGPRRCTIEGRPFYFQWPDANGFILQNGEGRDSVISGFTIKSFARGIYCDESSSPRITNCRFSVAWYGIECASSSPLIIQCTFSGCGMYLSSAFPRIVRCRFWGANDSPWGLEFYDSSPRIINCTISGYTNNGIHCSFNSVPVITNSTITQNGTGLRDEGGISCPYCFPVITNSIVWGNSPKNIMFEPIPDDGSRPQVTYSCIGGGWKGEGNMNCTPLFVNAAKRDYHLQPNSPCIDTGTMKGAPANDIEGDERPYGSSVDMGADEFVPVQ